EEAFAKVDGYIDGKTDLQWLEMSAKEVKNWRKAIDDLLKKAGDYLPEIEKAIEGEKSKDGGKEASLIYRDLKILKTDLNKLTARAEFDYAQVTAKRETELGGVASSCKAFYEQLRKCKENLKNAVAKANSKAQAILKSGAVADYNTNIETMARDVTQALQNIRDFSFPLEIIRPDKQEKVYAALEDKDFYTQARTLFETSQLVKGELLQVLAVSGGTPLDASIVRIANNAPKLANDATADDVKKAAKHFLSLIKAVEKIQAKL
ncbi:MAG TPA: hypothetical protein VGE52_17245, partial [Pirellulales bacterium]